MISLPSLTLLILYCISLAVSHQKPRYALSGLISFVLIIVSVAMLKAHQDSMTLLYGLNGFAYRWNAIMCMIVFGWFLAIQKTDKIQFILPVFILLLLDVISMLLSSYDTTLIDPYISAMMIACHLVYISGCVHGGLAQHSNNNSANKGGNKSARGDTE